MLQFIVTRGHGYTLKKVRRSRQAPPLRVMHYDRLLRARRLPRATYVFTDIDRLGAWDLELAGQMGVLMRGAGLTVWNNPALVKTRYPLLRTLHAAGLNDFNVYRADEPGMQVRFPVFVRKIHGHREPVSALLDTQAQLDQTITAAVAAGTPLANLLVVEYAAQPLRPGLFRKLSAFRIGRAIVPHISVHDTTWLVKYGQMNVAGEELYQEELALLQSRPYPYREHLEKVFDLAGIDYGRADFGIYQGRIQVYEINTNPMVAPPGKPHPSPARRQSLRLTWDLYVDALRALDGAPGGGAGGAGASGASGVSGGFGGSVAIANGSLQPHRLWRNLLVLSRKVQ